MFFSRLILVLALLWPAFAASAEPIQLVMVERQGCHYCITWKTKIGPIYPRTDAGKFAPLRMVDIADPQPTDLTFIGAVVYTPTFILIDAGHEIGRIEGYPGEDFFWGFLEKLLAERAGFQVGS